MTTLTTDHSCKLMEQSESVYVASTPHLQTYERAPSKRAISPCAFLNGRILSYQQHYSPFTRLAWWYIGGPATSVPVDQFFNTEDSEWVQMLTNIEVNQPWCCTTETSGLQMAFADSLDNAQKCGNTIWLSSVSVQLCTKILSINLNAWRTTHIRVTEGYSHSNTFQVIHRTSALNKLELRWWRKLQNHFKTVRRYYNQVASRRHTQKNAR